MSCEKPCPNFASRISLYVQILLILLLMTAAKAALAVMEAEPNNSCATAQNAGALSSATITVMGALTTPPTTPDVDFYKFTAQPGTLFQVALTGASDGTHTLEVPIVEALNSSCGYLYSSGPVDPISFQIAVPPDGVVILGVSSSPDFGFTGAGQYAGTYTFAVTQIIPVQSISGRAVDAATRQPISGVLVTLNLCRDPTCVSGDFTGNFFTDSLGQFSFASSAFGTPLPPGNYQLSLNDFSGNHVPAQSPIFSASSSEQKVIPDIAMTPTPVIGSIRGRIMDSVTRAPLFGISVPYAHISIIGCNSFGACSFLDGFADSMGRFRFDHDQSGRGIVAGAAFNAFVSADQYQEVFQFIPPIDVDANLDLGDIQLVSNPIRFNVVQGCSSIPLTGGVCKYEVEITNGIASPVRGSAWAIITANGLTSFVTNSAFQTGDPQDMNLAPATRKRRSSRTATFEFAIPGSVPTYAFICPTFWFGVDPNPQLNVQGSLYAYTACVQRTATGYTPATPDQVRGLRKEAREHEARERAKVLPQKVLPK
jgi:hypothetical protein